jgi:MoaA/NifB/PqqE/SkfB family radical SAM enzyme
MIFQSKLKNINARLFPHKLFYAPNTLVLGVNNVCNLHCKMCDVGTQNLESNFAQNLVGTWPLHMPVELFKMIADQTATYFPKTILGYAFTEPLAYKHLEDTLFYAQSKGLRTSITTNALTLRQKAAAIVESGVEDLYISLDGPEAIHNEIRGNQRSFQRALEGIEAVCSYETRLNISIYCVITEWNIGYLHDFVNFFKHYPLKTLGLLHTNYTSQQIADAHNSEYGAQYPATDSNLDQVDLSKFDLDILWREIERIRNTIYPFPVTFSPEINSIERLRIFYHAPEILWGKRCNDANRNIMIKSDGTVIPAHGRCYNLPVGNLYRQSLPEIWNSPAITKFRKDLNRAGGLLPACSRCCSAF